ncbi:MAG: hypothetical protein JWO51_2455 [Rhodospirillales bacterium]|nr:hypothetical protein [Rhodospirillales bacterium]
MKSDSVTVPVRNRRPIRHRAPIVALATAMLLVGSVHPALPQAVNLVVVDVASVAAGYRASKLIGKAVVNDKNEKIGSLDDLVVGQEHVLFAILQVGGFLGVGGHLVATPYTSLTLEDAGSKIVLPGASKDALKKLPEFKYGA